MRKVVILFIILICPFLFPFQAAAHAVLTNANPSADSRLDESPEEVVLLFNEAIKAGLSAVKVMNQDKELITEAETTLSNDNKQLKTRLPALSEGAYLVSYTVISADGHPISGSYVFLIGNAALPANLEISGDNPYEIPVFVTRAAYYFGLLSVTGWILWGVLQERKHNDIQRRKFRFVSLILQQYHLLCLIILIAVQWLMNTTVSGIPLNTGFGLSWIFSLLLSLLGFFLLFKAKWLDCIWIILMLVAKGFNGHSASYGPMWISVPIDFLHLFGAAVWTGGLLYIVIFWKKHRLHIKDFIPLFSKGAFISMLILFMSGIALTVLYLPSLDYLWVTPWGIFLLTKVFLVFLVILTAGIIRYYLKKKSFTKNWQWLKVDFGFMVLILLVVGGLSYLSPVPANTPLKWEEKSSQTDMTLTITPNAPGKNSFQVEFTEHTIKRAELWLQYENSEEIAPIQVPLKPAETDGLYVAEGYYLPFDGKWVAHLKIVDQNGAEKIFTKGFRIFKTESKE
ncbi:copper resistance protein CopC [Niallia taxi]|uniref:copper resistance CopC/CopD family protein n=1 Tax=Niallia taxi TaxID=2499688 RepID=UPI0039823683